jgi:hypothetical protein
MPAWIFAILAGDGQKVVISARVVRRGVAENALLERRAWVESDFADS